MNFTEFEFWPRLFACLALIFGLRKCLSWAGVREFGTYDKAALAAMSLYLLASVNTLTFAVFCVLATLAFGSLQIIARLEPARRKWFLAVAIPIILLPLAYFKYRDFLVEKVLGWERFTFDAVVIPAGISFYTFQIIAILVDSSRLKSYRPKVLDFINFKSFFPQVVAGPIERKVHLMPQMERFRFRLRTRNLEAGIPWLALGFFYKLCLADNISPFIARDAMDSAWPILWTTLLFGLKIYFDFCGYSLIALGLARVLGVRLILNFCSPYLAGTVREFWRRWHVSLSYWFRDYVYFPLGGSRTRWWAFNLMAVFTISGLWHGAGWNFLLWGALHGGYCVVGHTLGDRLRLPRFVSWPLTMFFVFAAWLPFYETRDSVLIQKLGILVTPAAYAPAGLRHWIGTFETGSLLTMLAAVGLCGLALVMEAFSLRGNRRPRYYAYARNPYVVAALVALTVWLGASHGNEFIYFTF